MKNKILIIEDDKDINEMVSNYLIKEGFEVCTAFNGEEGIEVFLKEEFDLVLLDIMMPKMDGLEVMRVMREKSVIPILIMSAKDSDIDKAVGLGMGADDYIAKPFSLLELSARIKAMIRRVTKFSKEANIDQTHSRTANIHNLFIDFDNFCVTKEGKNIKLTAKEFDILRLFVMNPNRVFTKAQVYNLIWNDDYYGDENVINVHMRRLREKLEEDPKNPKIIKTLWGIGYRLGEF